MSAKENSVWGQKLELHIDSYLRKQKDFRFAFVSGLFDPLYDKTWSRPGPEPCMYVLKWSHLYLKLSLYSTPSSLESIWTWSGSRCDLYSAYTALPLMKQCIDCLLIVTARAHSSAKSHYSCTKSRNSPFTTWYPKQNHKAHQGYPFLPKNYSKIASHDAVNSEHKWKRFEWNSHHVLNSFDGIIKDCL